MYLFARRRRINTAEARAAIGVAIEAATRVQKTSGLQVWVWNPVLSPEVGVVSWTARADHLNDLVVAEDKLNASSKFSDWVEQNDSMFQGPIEDSVLQVLQGAPSAEPPAYVQLVRAVCAHGAMSEALGLGAELAELGSRLTGMQTMFGAGVTGPYGTVAWLTGAPDLRAVEDGNAAMMANDEWGKLIDRAGHAFQPGVTSSLIRRLN